MSIAMSEWRLGPGGAEQYERYKVRRLFGPMAEAFLDQITLRGGDRVLDVACGTGAVARAAARRGAHVVGVDIDPAMLEVAHERALREGTRVQWLPATVESLPFPERSFDVVTCQQALQFFPDRVRALREMGRVVAAKGIIALDVFAAGGAYSAALAAALGRRKGAAAARRCLAAGALGRSDEIAALLDQAGLRCLEIRLLSMIRRIEPTQESLRQDSASTPYGADIESLDAFELAEVVREMAGALKRFWYRDCFRVPLEFHVALAARRLGEDP